MFQNHLFPRDPSCQISSTIRPGRVCNYCSFQLWAGLNDLDYFNQREIEHHCSATMPGPKVMLCSATLLAWLAWLAWPQLIIMLRFAWEHTIFMIGDEKCERKVIGGIGRNIQRDWEIERERERKEEIERERGWITVKWTI